MREPGKDSKGGRAGIVLNGSPLFAGAAGSGESEIRKWILDRDYLEAIIALPTDMFYNTGISTYVWILSKDKTSQRKGKVQLIDGSKMFRKMRRGLGSKRNELGPEDIAQIVKLYGQFEETKQSKIFPTSAFFYRTITVERPLRLNFRASPERIQSSLATKTLGKLTENDRVNLADALAELDATYDGGLVANREVFAKALDLQVQKTGLKLSAPQKKALLDGLSQRDLTADVCVDKKGKPEADSSLRDTEDVPWDQDMESYFEREVKPFVADAWIDYSKTKEGCEIPFTRHFYEYVEPRSLAEIDADLDAVLGRIRFRLEQVKV
jgi:type I restriction enzyme M protein